VFGYDTVVYDSDKTDDMGNTAPIETGMRRVLLRRSGPSGLGPFGPLLGSTEIELVSRADGAGRKIYRERFWGDLGFIHLCFDIQGMTGLKAKLAAAGFPLTVDSAQSFNMGQAAGHFTYCEDPDGTLIEMVETHKVPVAKKIGLYLHLKKRKPGKPLPRWIIKLLALGEVKN